MLIYKILNNNAVISRDNQNREIIVTGKGIAFKKGEYDEIDEELILQVFILENHQEKTKLEMMVSEIPYDYFVVAEKIKKMAEGMLNCELADSLVLRLSDHIHYSVMKEEKGIVTPNLMLDDLERFYSKEYEIGLLAILAINQSFDTNFDANEAGFIAFHIINCEEENNSSDMQSMIDKLQVVTSMIEEYFQIELKKNPVDYSRLVTHLKFFFTKLNRGIKEKPQTLKNDTLFEMLIEKYAEINNFLDRISAMTLLSDNYELSDSDRMYLIIHLARLLDK